METKRQEAKGRIDWIEGHRGEGYDVGYTCECKHEMILWASDDKRRCRECHRQFVVEVRVYEVTGGE